jgi:lipoprotein-releasing system permease protein
MSKNVPTGDSRELSSVPLLTWLRSLWPQRFELRIAKRYLLRRRASRVTQGLSVVLVLCLLGLGLHYFTAATPPAAEPAFLLLFLALSTVTVLLLNFLSVFSTVAVVGVMLGVAALTVVMAVTSGFQAEIRDRVIGLNAHILILKYGTDFQEYDDVAKTLAQNPEVLATSPFVYNEMLVAKEGALSSGVLVKGIDPVRAQKVVDLQQWLHPLADGKRPLLSALQLDQSPNDGGPPLPGAFVGAELARKLKLKVGDRLRLIAPLMGLEMLAGDEPKNSDGPPPPHAQEFRLVGIFTAGFDEYDRRLVIIGLPRAQDLVGQGNVVTGVELRCRNVDRARLLGGELVKTLSGGAYRSLDWEELNHNLFTALALQKAVLTLVLFLIILVAAFNIVASLTMMVIDKTREVAILKAMGASAPSIASVFRIAGMVIGLLGTLLGVGMGLLTCGIVRRLHYLLDAKVYMIDKLPVQLSPREILWTSGVTVLISLVATLYPSLRAGRMRPVDGLRED